MASGNGNDALAPRLQRPVRVVTYNVHKCVGIDGRERPDRIAGVLEEVGADVIALQEVVNVEGAAPELDQARYLAGKLGLSYAIGEARELRGGRYGNVVLSRFPMRIVCNHDITVRGRERRAVLHMDVEVEGCGTLHVFNVHLGTSFVERRHQGRRLVDQQVLMNQDLKGAKILLGDFNEWTPGLASQLVAAHLKSVDVQSYFRRRHTYPGVFPFLHLDHIYYDERLTLEKLLVHRTRLAVMASDHLPLVADFRVPQIGSTLGKTEPGQVVVPAEQAGRPVVPRTPPSSHV
jgi:endonuclease/exonuclease/phosphatase family metal-dependent hydrolase